MLAYMRLIIREAHKHRGQGWLTYDAVFRRNHQGASQWWNVLDTSLHTAYIAGQGSATKVPCRHCNEANHAPEDCALAPMTPSVRPTPPDRLPFALHSPRHPPPFNPPLPATKKLCISWNRGQCSFPGACSFRHSCAICDSRDHRARDYARAPTDSFAKTPPRRIIPQQPPLPGN